MWQHKYFLGMPPPNVVAWIKDKKLREPLCFTAIDASATIAFNKVGAPDAASIMTSIDKQTWEPYTFNTVITLANPGDKVYFRATDENDISFYKADGSYYRFATTAGKKIAASGNIQTLMKADGSRLDISGKSNCYYNMFRNCTSLTTAPALPATTLANNCYAGMFVDCSSLTTAPALPAMKLAYACYASMFRNCTSLTSAPELPAPTLAHTCYNTMFAGCSKLMSMDVSFTVWNLTDATLAWVSEVAASGTFTCPSTLPKTTGDNYIPEGWTIIEK